MKQAILLLTACLIGLQAYAQDNYTQTVRGTVVEKVTGMSLPGAEVLLVIDDHNKRGAVTDLDGNFRFENVPVGRISLFVSYLGYETVPLRNLLLQSGKELVLHVELEENVMTTEEVVVEAQKRKDVALNDMATVSARSFSIEQTERFAGSLGDPSRMVANYAGVMSVSDERNDIIVRGNTPMSLLWQMNGMEIPNPNHFAMMGTTGGAVSMLNNNLLANSDFFSSAFPAEYGGGLAAAFDLRMRPGNNQQREYLGQIGFNGFELGAEGPFKKGSQSSYLANYRYSTLEVLSAMGMDFGTGTAIPHYQDLSFNLSFPTKDYGKFEWIGVGGISSINFDFGEVDENTPSYGMKGMELKSGSNTGFTGLTHYYFLDDKTTLRSYISLTGKEDFNFIDSLPTPHRSEKLAFYNGENAEVKYTGSVNITRKINAKNNIEAGVIFDHYNMWYSDSVLMDTTPRMYHVMGDARDQMQIVRAYAQWQHHFTDELRMITGLHHQYMALNGNFTIEPRAGLEWEVGGRNTFSLGYGLHAQKQPTMFYFYQTRMDDGSYTMTNQDLDFSKSHHYVVGHDFLVNQSTHIKTEVYYQYLYDIPVKEGFPEFSLLNQGGDFGVWYQDSLVNKGTGQNMGIELTVERMLHKGYYYLATLSVYDSKYKGYDGVERNTKFNGNYLLNALGGKEWSLNQKASITLDVKGTWAGGQRIVPIDEAASMRQNEEKYDWENVYEEQYQDYLRFDLRIGYRLNGKHISQEWALDLQNITDRDNISKRGWDTSENEIYESYQTGFMPMMLYRIQF